MTERVSVNVRFPASLHKGLVELAQREHRSLNDMLIFHLSNIVVESLTPKTDPLHELLERFMLDIQPYREFWSQRYPLSEIDLSNPPIESVHGIGVESAPHREYIAKMMVVNERMERALVAFAQAYEVSKQLQWSFKTTGSTTSSVR